MDSIEIAGFKSIRKAKLEFKPINILIGANGAGKSNFIRFFEFLNRLYEQKLKEYVALNGGADQMLFQGIKNTNKITSTISFNGGENQYSFDLEVGTDHLVVTSEVLRSNGAGIHIDNFGGEALIKSYLSNAKNEWEHGRPNIKAVIFDVNKHLQSFRLYHFHDTGKTSPFTKSSNTKWDTNFLYEKGDNLAAYLYGIRENTPKVYRRIVRMVQSIAPFFSDFYLEPNANDLVHLQWTDKFSSTTYGPTNFSDGTIRFIALATLFMQPKLPAALLIDEPELGLHPRAITKLAGLIKSASQRGCKVIVSTQSSDLVNHFLPEDVVTVDMINGESQFRRLDAEKLANWLEDYALGDLWKQSIIEAGQPQ